MCYYSINQTGGWILTHTWLTDINFQIILHVFHLTSKLYQITHYGSTTHVPRRNTTFPNILRLIWNLRSSPSVRGWYANENQLTFTPTISTLQCQRLRPWAERYIRVRNNESSNDDIPIHRPYFKHMTFISLQRCQELTVYFWLPNRLELFCHVSKMYSLHHNNELRLPCFLSTFLASFLNTLPLTF